MNEQLLRDNLDQLWGWAKAGKTVTRDGLDIYLMDVENVDRFTDDVLRLVRLVVEADA